MPANRLTNLLQNQTCPFCGCECRATDCEVCGCELPPIDLDEIAYGYKPPCDDGCSGPTDKHFWSTPNRSNEVECLWCSERILLEGMR